MQKVIYLNKSRKYRKLFYIFVVMLSSFTVGSYFRNSYLLYVGFVLIILSILYECLYSLPVLEAIVLPKENEKYFKVVIGNQQSDFWKIKKHIVINGWIYLCIFQEGSNKSFKLWLHKSNFKDKNETRLLAKKIILENL
ncbi:hypothetical protein IB642_01030 [Allofrancisella guangzhouensis]|uniref:Uncharacterized protein n=1 Tax=Allofrancisella guangzhouensis TaxID=594679 RepID=A0A0A8E5C4_9GAMM|nr:hypothetical protein [Allofrancisella guangzhouensis]AJC49134.1 hypothetical protein SD28_05545 [Allofrancisella guangzhouensis]MBK2026851.1 hypothetical protein [Allofrancisella guangzhouensis]MBK2043601.1 hypothetical protein [Allofrancisella guangzhouensis]MBK2046348.1 hypothetical protein [Allofrancisella guangzhouensis]